MLNLSTNLPAAEVCSTVVLARPGTTVITRRFDQHSLSKGAIMRQDGHPRPVHISTCCDILQPSHPTERLSSSEVSAGASYVSKLSSLRRKVPHHAGTPLY